MQTAKPLTQHKIGWGSNTVDVVILCVVNLDQLRADVGRFGWTASISSRLLRRLLTHLGIHLCVVRTRALRSDPPNANLPLGIRLAILDRDQLLRTCNDEEMDLTHGFVDAALERGDVAFGALHEDRVVNYMWRTFTAAPHTDGLWIWVSKPYRYGYKGFTHPSYRGQYINAVVSFFSDAHFLERGYTYDIGFVAAHNMASLATSKRKGNTAIGYAGHVRWFGRCFPWRTRRVRETGFEFFHVQDR